MKASKITLKHILYDSGGILCSYCLSLHKYISSLILYVNGSQLGPYSPLVALPFSWWAVRVESDTETFSIF